MMRRGETVDGGGLSRASKKRMRELRRFWDWLRQVEADGATGRPRFAARNRANIGLRDWRRAFGTED